MSTSSKHFIHQEFLLQSDLAQKLYFDYAADQPIIDFHSHLSPADIATNKKQSALNVSKDLNSISHSTLKIRNDINNDIKTHSESGTNNTVNSTVTKSKEDKTIGLVPANSTLKQKKYILQNLKLQMKKILNIFGGLKKPLKILLQKMFT